MPVRFDRYFEPKLKEININVKALGKRTRKLSFRRDLRWVAKRIRKYTQVANKTVSSEKISCILLANMGSMDVTQVVLSWVGWSNGEKLASTCVKI